MGDGLPGRGLWGWLGRQVGYVRGALRAEVGAGKGGGGGSGEKVVYREEKVAERPLPGAERVVLRRTVVDEVVVEGDDGGGPAAGGVASAGAERGDPEGG